MKKCSSFLFIGPTCIKALDLAIIIDKSKSVGQGNLKRLKQNLVSFLHLFEVSAQGTHVGMISFNDNAELLFDFKDDRYHEEDQLKERIKEIPLKLELKTRTDLALTLAKEKLFTVEGGDRPNVPNVCVVFTDGKSTGKPKNKGFVPIPETVEYLTEVGIHLLIHPASQAVIYPFIYPSIHPPIYPSIHQSIHSGDFHCLQCP